MLTTRKIAENYQILRVITGSQLYGTSLEGNSDQDQIGICIAPPDHVIALRRFQQFSDRTAREGERSKSGDLDLTIFGLRRWMELATQGNPNILEVLFAPEAMHDLMTVYGFHLLQKPEMIVSKAAGKRYLGFMSSQRGALMGTSRAPTTRTELVEKFGYDTKFAYHAVRVGIEGIELLQTGRITFPLPEEKRRTLMNIRRGFYDLKEVLEIIEDVEVYLRLTLESSDLPDAPDFEQIDKWIVNTHIQYWREHSLI